MSSTPNPIVPAAGLKRDLSWLTHHIILVGIIVLVLFSGVYEVENLMEKHDKAREAASAASLQLVVSQVKALEDHMVTNDAAAAQREAQYQAIISQQMTVIATTNKNLQSQIQKNATLTAQQAAARLAEQYKVDASQVQASGDTIIASLPLTRQFVDTFDKNVACQTNLTATTTQLTAEQGINKDLTQKVSDRDGVITGKNDELGKQKKNYDDQITVLKADARKGKLKWFGIGFVTGYIAAKAERVFGF